MAHVESWKDEANRSHVFSGRIFDHELSLQPGEVIARVKDRIVFLIADQVMQELGPLIETAVRDALKKKGRN